MMRIGPFFIPSALINLALYQAGWFACVLGAAGDRQNLGAAVAVALALMHLALTARPRVEMRLMLAAVAVGLVVDTFHGWVGVLDFRGHEPGSLAPAWIVVLWLQFATVLHYCMSWLSRRYLLASAVGLFGAPLAFLGGERLGAATFGEPRGLSVALVAVSWAVALPILVRLADRWPVDRRYRVPGAPACGIGSAAK